MSEPARPAWSLGAVEAGAALAGGRLTATALAEAVLERLEAVNPRLNAVVAVNPRVMDEAAESDRRLAAGAPRSALEGIPVTVKDNLLARGMPATWGSRLFEHHVPAHDEIPVERLRGAGAVVLGKTNVPEFTVEGYTANLLHGVTGNPWDPALTPGGSSGGAVAAVASGVGPLAIGTDGGGSIRRPACHAGLVGFKPTIGRIPRGGGFERILLDMEVVGPLARTVADARLLFDTLAGPDPRDPRSLLPAGTAGDEHAALRVVFVPAFGDAPVDPQVAASVATAAAAFEAMGHRVEERGLPFALDAIDACWPVIAQVGIARLLEAHPGADALVGPAARALAEAGREVPATRYSAAVETVAELRRTVAESFTAFDILLTPCAAALPWPAAEPYPATIDGRPVGPRGHAVFTGWVNACGFPAVSVPTAPSREGLPIGLQLVGAHGRDGQVLDLAQRYEARAPWAGRWPDLAPGSPDLPSDAPA